MEANVKLGTRCECRQNHTGANPVAHDVGGCPNDAVRMVTVLRDTGSSVAAVRDVVPMCEACAAYHEARQKERV